MFTTIKFKKTLQNAEVPKQATENDVGYDLTAVEFVKKLSDNTYMYDTGICVKPPPGFYTEIVPRSSIVKTGYMLSNSVGVIDPHYTGSLKICFTKVDQSCPDLEVPFTKCQLIVKRAEYGVFEEVLDFETTMRGDGGFGSTDKV
jgi:dUTP pyrophosphatase